MVYTERDWIPKKRFPSLFGFFPKGGIVIMVIRKSLATGTAVLLLSLLVVIPVSAHGHHRQAAAQADTQCPVCTVEGCTETGRHTHDGIAYCGYNHSSGYCDGTCEYACEYAAPRCGNHGCHHGCH